MDLRSGHSYWVFRDGVLAEHPSLQDSERSEVAVVGGGITGALVAYHLAKAGVDTVLLDKRAVAMGSTAASTSLLQYALDLELAALVRRVGEAHAVRAYQLNAAAIDALEALLPDLGDRCGFRRRCSLYVASAASHTRRLDREAALRRVFGLSALFLSPTEALKAFPFARHGAIYSECDAEVDAYRLTHRLLQAAAKRGLRIYANSELVASSESRNRVTLEIRGGGRVVARRVVFATGYESQRYLRPRIGTLQSTYALATQPLETFPPWPGRCLIWESSRPYTYLRTTGDNRILIGGLDTPYADDHRRDALLRRRTRELKKRLDRMFPHSRAEVAYAWAGTFGSTKDGLAYIGSPPGRPRALFAVGYGGNGLTMAVIAARIITDAVRGKRNRDAEIFRFGR
jgi:glycine/D-amino acid oxidase-like deaminating enzyme